MNKYENTKICQQCSGIFLRRVGHSDLRWSQSKFCSKSCFGKSWKPIYNERIKTPENHPRWKGDSVGYFGIHDWIEKVAGKPKCCQVCGTTEKKMYHWANLSGSYFRDIRDWKRMCVPCHRKYDYSRKTN